MLAVKAHADTRDFERLADEWRELLADSDADPLFLSWEWLFSWWCHLGGGRDLRLITVRRAGRLVAVAPLAVRPPSMRRLQPFELLEFLGTGSAGSDYLDLVVRRGYEGATLQALCQYFGERRLGLELSHAVPGSLAGRLAASLAGNGWSHVAEDVEVCPYIDLAGQDWDSYLATLGASHRYNVRRRFRKLERGFDARFECVADEGTRQARFRELIRLHHLRRDTLGGSDGLDGEATVAFHDTFSALALRAGWLRLYRLTLDGTAVAALYGFQCGGRFYFYQSGFDPAYRKHSVGLLMLAHTIRAAIGEGACEYDLLHGDEPYKYHWAAAERTLVRHHLYPPHVRGNVARHLFGLKQQIKTTCRVA